MKIILLAASIASSSIRSLLSKRLSDSSGSAAAFGRVNGLMSFCALIIVFIYSYVVGVWHCSALTLWMAILYAVFTLLAQLFYMRALGNGNVATVTFFYSCGFIIPTFSGALLYEEKLSVWALVGVIMLVIAFRLCAEKSDAPAFAGKRSWLISAIIAMLSSGAVGLIQKVHQKSAYREELGPFLVTAFTVCTVISLSLALTRPRELPRAADAILPVCICGACIGSANLLNLRLAGLLPAIVTFPVVNGGVTVVSAIAAIWIYREVLTRRRLIGIALGIAAILLIVQ